MALQLTSAAPAAAIRAPLPGTPTSHSIGTDAPRDLVAGHVDGAAYGGMVGLGETYLPAFVLAVGLGEVMAGLVASVPLAAGGLMQLISPRMVRALGSHKRWVMCCASAQALSFVPLVYAAWQGAITPTAVLLAASLYWAAGLAAGPAWNTWVGSIVSPPIRARYFALRTRLSQAAVLCGFLAAGFALHSAKLDGSTTYAFAFVFAAAGICRAISVAALAQQSEPCPLPPAMRHIPLRKVARSFLHGSGSQLLVYIVAVQACVQLSGPYFTPFMLRELHLSYAEYVILIASAFAMRVACLPLFGQFAQRFGAPRLLWVGGLGIVPMAGLWLVSDHFGWLLAIQIAGGAAWAAYELAFFLLFFESIDVNERTSVLTFYNFANTSAWVGGSLVGGAILATLGVSYESYLVLFGLSTVLRVGTIVLLWRVPGVRVEGGTMGIRTIALRPNGAVMDAPVLPSLPDRVGEEERERSESLAV